MKEYDYVVFLSINAEFRPRNYQYPGIVCSNNSEDTLINILLKDLSPNSEL